MTEVNSGGIPIDPDRLNRIHVHNVRFDNSKKQYFVVCLDPSDGSTFEVERSQWLSFGDWQQRKREGNYY